VDLLFLCGGGILGHPGGIKAGVKSVLQGWECAIENHDIDSYASTHPEFQQALEYFGHDS
jgi:ribulose-bisphosphate carboxylase large chain